MEFTHNTYDELGRIYHFDTGDRFHSVTTALGATADKSYLIKWRERIGDAEADRLVKKAQDMGEEFHAYGEDFLNKIPVRLKNNQYVFSLFKNLRPKLKPITEVHGVETVLSSSIARLAGRADGIVSWNGELAVLDFKLVNYWVDEWIIDYWLQCSIYAHMWQCKTQLLPKILILAMGNKKFGTTKIVIKRYDDYAPQAVNRIKIFHEKFNSPELN